MSDGSLDRKSLTSKESSGGGELYIWYTVRTRMAPNREISTLKDPGVTDLIHGEKLFLPLSFEYNVSKSCFLLAKSCYTKNN
jgi:hypothetical protein